MQYTGSIPEKQIDGEIKDTMIFQDEIYNEVAELGKKEDYRTVLVRGEDGAMMVCKELLEELVPVYQQLNELNHPNLVKLYGMGLYEGKPAAFMEYFPAVSLEEKMIQTGKFTLDMVKRIMLQICDAVYCFHKKGIIHRDLSPSNILINPQGLIKITDFGIARFHKKGQASDTVLLGTAGFAAPEQFGFAQTDEKTDIYSLGVLMNWMLTGKFPVEELYRGEPKISAIIKSCINMNASERCEVQDIEKAIDSPKVHKGSLKRRILTRVPGFRTGNKVHMTLAVITYAYVTFMYLTGLFVFRLEGFWYRLVGFLICTMGIGWFVGSFSTMAYRFHMNAGGRKAVLFCIYFIIGFIILYFGFEFLLHS